MACRDAYKTISMDQPIEEVQNEKKLELPKRLRFGVDSKIPSSDILQNNIDLFEWVTRNKLYPVFWGRNIVDKNALTKKEIQFLHCLGCKIAAICNTADPKETEEQGRVFAEKVAQVAIELEIPKSKAIFLEIRDNEKITTKYLYGFAKEIQEKGYTSGFKANTDAKFAFDREFSRGMQTNKDVFDQCLIWAEAPSLAEYDRVTTTHLIHPDNWKPFAPSGITRNDIAVWQYGKNCHPIYDDSDKEITFNIDLVGNEHILIDKMF